MLKYEATCDRCGAHYEPFFPKKMDAKLYFNGIMFVTFDHRHNYHRKGNVDLCQKCCKELQNFLFPAITVTTVAAGTDEEKTS